MPVLNLDTEQEQRDPIRVLDYSTYQHITHRSLTVTEAILNTQKVAQTSGYVISITGL